MRILRIIILVLMCLLFAAVMARGQNIQNPNSDEGVKPCGPVGEGLDFYSLEKEIALGKQLAQEVERQTKLLNDPTVTEYVNRVGQNIVRNSDAKVPFTIKMIDSGEVNAFALPGGFFFVNVGLVMMVDGEAELAGVMAHEIGHVADRHGTKQATRAELAQIGTIPLIFLGGVPGMAARNGISAIVPISFLKFSRVFEEKADCLGLVYMYRTGYDPNALVSMFERIESQEKKKPGTMAKVFETHPPTEDRIARAQKLLNNRIFFPPKDDYVVTTSEFADVKARLRMPHDRKDMASPDKPVLRRKMSPVDDNGNKTDTDNPDDRPTLKRKDGGQ
jgi:predicted Zn-dependent protease